MVRLRSPILLTILSALILWRLRHAPGQSADHGGRHRRPGYRFETRPARSPRQGKPGHPRVLGRRHARRRVLLRRAGVPAPDRGRRAEGQQGPPARRGRRHHRRVRRQLHRAGLRPLRRQAVRRLRAALPEAQRPGRDRRPHASVPATGATCASTGVGPLRAGGPALRRDPVQRRDVRRSRPRRRPADPGVRHRHLDRRPRSSSTRPSSTCICSDLDAVRCRARPRRRRRCRSCSRRSRSTTTAAPATTTFPTWVEAVHRYRRTRRGPRPGRYAS